MCKHILNPQVKIRAPCCKLWFDCADCHAEQADHPLLKQDEMVLVCKPCKKAFRLDVTDFDEAKEYCPHCDNHFYKQAVTPQAALVAEKADLREDNRLAQLRDMRMKLMLNDDADLFDDDITARLG